MLSLFDRNTQWQRKGDQKICFADTTTVFDFVALYRINHSDIGAKKNQGTSNRYAA